MKLFFDRAALLALVLLVGCRRPAVAWIVPESDANNLEFGVSTKLHFDDPVESLTSAGVTRCAPRTAAPADLWRIRRQRASHERVPTRLRYGHAPFGYETEVAATELGPGCYVFFAGGAGTGNEIVFQVDSAKRVWSLVTTMARPGW